MIFIRRVPIFQWCVLASAWLAGLNFGLSGAADDVQAIYFRGLRHRGLFQIAEDYAIVRLNDARLLPDERAQLTVELARTLTDHGAISSVDQREELWAEAQRLLTQFVLQQAKNPRRLQIEAELAMLPSRFGETLAWEFEINPVNQAAGSKATEFSLQAVHRLQQFLNQQSSRPAEPSSSQLADGALTAAQIQELLQHVRYRLAFSRFYLARTSEAGPARAAHSLDAANALESLAKDRPESRWTVRARLLRAQLYRLEGEERRAEALLQSMADDAEVYALEDEVLAEQVRVALARQQIDDALELISRRTRQGAPLSDEIRAVAVESLLEAWKIARSKDQTALQEELLLEAQRHHGLTQGKWQQLTYYRLQQVQQDLEIGSELAQLVRDGQWKYHQGELQQATETFSQAAALAHRQNKTDLAVEYALTVGSIQSQQEAWTDAGQTFEQIVKQFPKHPKSGNAGLLHCYALGQIYRAEPSAKSRTDYESALERHRSQFRGSSTAIEATWMLAIHQEQRLQWTNAIDLYREIPADHPKFDLATLRIVVLYDKLLTRLRDLDGPVETWEDELLKEIVRIEDQFPKGSVLRSLEQCQATLRIAQLLLQHRSRWYVVADQWLLRIQDTVRYQQTEASIAGEALDPQWQQINRAAAQLRIVSLAGQQKLGEARAVMLELQKTDPSTMLSILLGLTELSSKVDPQRQVELGHLQLEAINRLSKARDQLTAQQQRMLDDSHAEAFIAIGNLPEAATIYESLLEESPRDQRLIRKVIAVLEKRGKAEDLQRARSWWTKLEKQHPPGSVEWITARLNIAKLDARLGAVDQARKLLGVTRTLYPSLGHPELKQEFETFLTEINEL